MKKILFLDNDGVICLSNNWGSRRKKQEKWGGRKLSMGMAEIPLEYRFDNFDEKAVEVLNGVLEKTGAEIVVSSDWRLYANLEELGEYYTSQGISKRPVGMTRVIGNLSAGSEFGFPFPENFGWDRTFGREQERSLEILDWLERNPDVTHWVAIDDLHMGKYGVNSSYGKFDRDWGLDHFVWTPRDNEGIKQSGVKEKLLKHLL
jgi:hypothetical protein